MRPLFLDLSTKPGPGGVKTADDIIAENSRLRDLVRRMIDFMERKHAVSDHDRALLREAREALGKDKP